MQYETQLFYKRKQVIDNFQRIGKFPFPEVNPILASDPIFAYRNQVEYTFSNKRWLEKEEMDNAELLNTNGLGFHLPGMFDKILDIHHCYLHEEQGNEIRNAVKQYAIDNQLEFWNPRQQTGLLRNLIIRTSVSGDLMVIVVFTALTKQARQLLDFLKKSFPAITSLIYVENAKQNDSIADLPTHTHAGADYMLEQMNRLRFKVSPLAFYQTNANQAIKLYEVTARFANATENDIVYDLYTGTGTIALFVASTAKKVVGVESVESAIENAIENAKLNNITNAEFFVGDMAKVFTDDFVEKNGKPAVIIVDPPRSGMHPKVVEQILKIAPQRIVYVSCNPATQARDISLMADSYDITEVQPLDMFPHTHHVENAVVLVRKTRM
jgi:23S rRNA (uracil1939-C5)-methyltransferase